MKFLSRRMRLLLVLGTVLGAAGAGVAYVHRFVASQIETAIRSLGEGRVKVGAVRGNLLRGMTIEGFEMLRDVAGETRVSVKLPVVRVRYDLASILTGRHSAVPSQIEVVSPDIEIERRGPRLELYKLVNLLGVLRRDLHDVPITFTRGRVALSGEFPWKRTLDLALDDAFLEWTTIGLTYRAAVGWNGAQLSLGGSYDPGAALGHVRWEGHRSFAGQALSSALGSFVSTATTGTESLSDRIASARLTGNLGVSGEVLFRTSEPFPADGIRHWTRLDLERIGPLALAWDTAAELDNGLLASTGLPAPLHLAGFRLSWPSGAEADWAVGLAAFDGNVKLAGKLRWPPSGVPAFSARFDRLKLAAVGGLASLGAYATLSGVLEAPGDFPWNFRAQAARLALPRVPGELGCDLEGQVTPSGIRVDRFTARSGKASATGQATLDVRSLTYEVQAALAGVPPEWLEQATCVRQIRGDGIRADVRARGRLLPPTLDEGQFTAQAAALSVGGISAGDLRARGSFDPGRLTFDSVEGLGKAQLFSSFRARGVLITGKPAEVTGTVRGLRLDAYRPEVRGLAEADVKVEGGRHEIHARVHGFEVPGAGIQIPELSLELLPRANAEALQVSLPGRGRVDASVVWSVGAVGKLQAAGSFRLPDVGFLLASKGFLRGGRASGSFQLSLDPARGTSADFSLVELNLVTQRGPLVSDGPISGSYHKGRLVFSRSAIALAGGTLVFEGVAGASDASWDFKLETADLPIHLDGLAGGAGALAGRLFSAFQLSGSLARPTIVADFRLEKPRLAGQDERTAGHVLDRVRGKLTYRTGELSVERLVLQGGKQECTVTGRVPMQLAISPFSVALGSTPMDLRVVFPRTPLSVAALFLPWLPPAADGSFQADLSVSGTPLKPRVEGLLMATARKLELARLPAPLTDLTAKVIFSDNQAHIRELAAGMAGGKLEGSGRVTFHDGWKTAWDVNVSVSGLQISRKNLSLTDLTVKTHLGGEAGRLDIDSQFTFDKGLLDLAIFDGPPTTFFDTIPSWASYRIAGTTRGNFWVRSSAVNAELRGGLEMKGQGPEYKIGGELNAARGELHFQGNRFAIENGTVDYRTPPVSDPSLFPWQKQLPDTRRPKSVPYITARGSKEIGHTTIYMEVNGPAEHMNFNLRSLPAH
ncbi:MAG: translocation/assembly module TamB domain-containing protein, partial [Candidatus Wallbacteria bacterium]|nr:translocation/assembly module TamB domain-containing protein [Candidatus Wallbacteria bacterium]